MFSKEFLKLSLNANANFIFKIFDQQFLASSLHPDTDQPGQPHFRVRRPFYTNGYNPAGDSQPWRIRPGNQQGQTATSSAAPGGRATKFKMKEAQGRR